MSGGVFNEAREQYERNFSSPSTDSCAPKHLAVLWVHRQSRRALKQYVYSSLIDLPQETSRPLLFFASINVIYLCIYLEVFSELIIITNIHSFSLLPGQVTPKSHCGNKGLSDLNVYILHRREGDQEEG